MNALEKSDRLKLIVLAAFAALAFLTAASAFGQPVTNSPAVMTELEASRIKRISPAQQALKESLDKIVVGKVESKGKTLAEMLSFFYYESLGALPAGQSIRFIINVPPNHSQWGTPGYGLTEASVEELGAVRIQISPPLRNVTLATAIDAVVKGAERPIQFEVKDYGAAFSWKQPPVLPIFSRRFTVNTNRFLANLAVASGTTEKELRDRAQTLAPFGKTNNSGRELTKVLRRHVDTFVPGATTNAAALVLLYNDTLGVVFMQAREIELRQASAAILALDPQATSTDMAVNEKGVRLSTMIPTPEKDLLPLPANAAAARRAAVPPPPAPNPSNMVTRVYYLGNATFTNRLHQLGFGLKPATTNTAASVSELMRELFVRMGAFKTSTPLISVVVTNQALEPLTRLANGTEPITNKIARELLSNMGGRLATNYPPAPQVFFNDRKGFLMVRTTYADFALIEPAMHFFTTPEDRLAYASVMGLPPGPQSAAVLYAPLLLPEVSSPPASAVSLQNRFYQILDRKKFLELIAPGAASLSRKQFENSLLRYFARIGADFHSEQPDGKILIYDNLTNRILVRGTAGDLEIIERMIQSLNDPSPPARK